MIDVPGPEDRVRTTTLLAAAAIGAYALFVAGATTALSDAAAACPTWPGCSGPVADDPRLLVAWTHRLLAVGVGGLVLATAVAAWRRGASRRVRAATAAGAVGYPVQVGIGALAAGTAGRNAAVSTAHLAVGGGIVAALVAALAWALADATPATVADPDRRDRDRRSTGSDDAPSGGVAGTGRTQRIRRTVRAYGSLTKPRLMWLLCLVAAAGMALTGRPLRPGVVGRTLLGGVLAIGASGTFNHVLERDVDRRMRRTSDRPLATDSVPVRNAVAFGVALAAASIAVFWSVNPLTAALGAVAIAFYSVIYTLVLKPNTVQNTVLGGAAGALPALIGWAAVTEGIALPAVVLAGVIFLWTPAHFYNLALAYRDDYERGGFPMLPVVRGVEAARRHVVYYLGATLLATGALAAVADLGTAFAAVTVAGGAVFLAAVVRLHRERTRGAALRAFHASNAFLGATLVAVVVEGSVA